MITNIIVQVKIPTKADQVSIGSKSIYTWKEGKQPVIPYCPALLCPPPPFATYFQEKEGGGGRNSEDLC